MPEIRTPHPDLELGAARGPLAYALALPNAGIGPRTGVIFYVHGLGQSYDDDYARKILPYWADLYDCVAVSVDYFGSHGFFSDQGAAVPRGYALRPHPDFFLRLRERHGVSVEMPAGLDMRYALPSLLETLGANGIARLHPDCLLIRDFPGYMSFGVLPALDHLQVLHDILRRYPLDRRRLFVFGTSYGGTIAFLMAKFAPNTFRLVVENSCYSGVEDTLPLLYGGSTTAFGGISFDSHAVLAFSPDPLSPAYLSPARRMIRDLSAAGHYALPSDTVLHSYHCVVDEVAPTANKVRVAEALRGRRHELTLVGESDLDGSTFKVLEHAMRASLRRVFDRSYHRWLPQADAAPAITDFDLGTVNALSCGSQTYVFSYDMDGVRLRIV